MQTIQPYLTFDGNCRDAMAFYQSCLGGDVHLSTFGEFGLTEVEADNGRIMHAQLASGPTIPDHYQVQWLMHLYHAP